jgi:hypothetical protein
MINQFTVGISTTVYQIPDFETNMPECGTMIDYSIEYTDEQRMQALDFSVMIIDQGIEIYD